jgi:putative ATP-binding cassette transporter
MTDADMPSYRELFSVVFSDVVLFDRLFGLPHDTSREQIKEQLERLELQEKVSLDEGQLSTTLLSRGQQKRVALLSACLEDRPIYIFDEWAADQDPVFRRVFYYEILPKLQRQRKGVIVVSHDDAYFDVADTIIRMDYGKISSVEVLSDTAASRHPDGALRSPREGSRLGEKSTRITAS